MDGSTFAPGGVHRLPVRVYWEDTDGGGIVYHAGYLRFAERGRTELLRAVGVGQRELQAESGLSFVVSRMEIDFRRPAVLDDLLMVETRVADVAAASLRMMQTVRRADAALVELQVRVACVGSNGRPVRLPAPVREALANSDSLADFNQTFQALPAGS